jgi:D-sedoheptulose 7-phosphate isomerase
VRGERTDFLYPFLEGGTQDAGPLLAELAASAEAKATESAALWERSAAELGTALARAAEEMAERFAGGGRLFTFGNGGSSTDAATVAALFAPPPWGRPVPARSLAADEPS